MQAGRHADALQGFFLGEALANLAKDRHILFSPLDAIAAAGGQIERADVVINTCCH
jgi:hypothetical protein